MKLLALILNFIFVFELVLAAEIRRRGGDIFEFVIGENVRIRTYDNFESEIRKEDAQRRIDEFDIRKDEFDIKKDEFDISEEVYYKKRGQNCGVTRKDSVITGKAICEKGLTCIGVGPDEYKNNAGGAHSTNFDYYRGVCIYMTDVESV